MNDIKQCETGCGTIFVEPERAKTIVKKENGNLVKLIVCRKCHNNFYEQGE